MFAIFAGSCCQGAYGSAAVRPTATAASAQVVRVRGDGAGGRSGMAPYSPIPASRMASVKRPAGAGQRDSRGGGTEPTSVRHCGPRGAARRRSTAIVDRLTFTVRSSRPGRSPTASLTPRRRPNAPRPAEFIPGEDGGSGGADGPPPHPLMAAGMPFPDWPLERVRRVEAAVADQGSGAGVVREGLDLQAGCVPVLICWVSLSSSSTW